MKVTVTRVGGLAGLTYVQRLDTADVLDPVDRGRAERLIQELAASVTPLEGRTGDRIADEPDTTVVVDDGDRTFELSYPELSLPSPVADLVDLVAGSPAVHDAVYSYDEVVEDA